LNIGSRIDLNYKGVKNTIDILSNFYYNQ